MGWGNLFPLFGWQPGFAPAPETGLVSGPPRREAPEPANRAPGPASPTTQRPGGSPGGANRPAPRPIKKKRRGRKR
jgi:hypothetical protein